jgi:YVTN family beta-propeller protein
MRAPSTLFFAVLLTLGCTSPSDDTDGPVSMPLDGIGRDAVFVVNGADATITVLDPGTQAVVGDIVLQGVAYPHHAYLDAAGDRLYVAAPGIDLSGGHAGGGGEHGGGHEGAAATPAASMVLALSAADGELLAYHELAASYHNAIPAPGTSEVWTSESGAPGAVIVLDAETLDELDRITVGDEPAEITFAPDGVLAFVCNTGSGSVSVIDVGTRTVTTELMVGMTPVGAWPGADGNMYVDNEGSRTLSVISPSTQTVLRTIDLGFTPAFAAVVPGDELWVTDTDAGRVVAFDLADPGGGPVRTMSTGPGAHALALSADGGEVFVTNQDADTVSIVDIATGGVTSTVAVGGKPNGMAVRTGI